MFGQASIVGVVGKLLDEVYNGDRVGAVEEKIVRTDGHVGDVAG